MNLRRRLICLAAVAPALVPHVALAQAWPGKPIHFIVPVAPGGAIDALVRQIGQRLTAAWGQPVIVDNKPGAGTVIGTDALARAAPDGYTFGFVISSHLANPSLYAKLPYDTEKDFAPVNLLVTGPLVVVVNTSLPVSSLVELIAYSKAHPVALNYATGSIGDVGHLTGERLKLVSGMKMTHVPYKGAAAALNDLLGNSINVMINTPSALLPHINAGKLRALAVTSAARSEQLPGVPSVAEAVGDRSFDLSTFYGMLAPAGTPPEIVARMSAEVTRIVRSPEISASLAAQAFQPVGGSPQELKAYIDKGVAQSTAIVKGAGIRLE